MTDWKLIAKARGLELSDTQLQAHSNTLSQLESAVADLKRGLPLDAEPAPAFCALVMKVERAS